MAKDPCFPFYVNDFLGGTMFMNNEQVGIYIKLLCIQHQHGGIIDKKIFNEVVNGHQQVKDKFVETEDGFFNERLAREMEKRTIKSSNMSVNALKRWEEHKQKHCKSNAIAMPCKDKVKDKIKDKDEKEKQFLIYWHKYPAKRRHGKDVALKRFLDTAGSEKDLKDFDIAFNNYINSSNVKSGFILRGSRWFGEWRDWINYVEEKNLVNTGRDISNLLVSKLGKIATKDMIKSVLREIPENQWIIVDQYLSKRYPGGGDSFINAEREMRNERRENVGRIQELTKNIAV